MLLLHHGDDGAQGVVLNKPLEAEVDSVLPPWQAYVTPPAQLFQGGPVALDSALGIVTVPGDTDEPLGVRRLFGGLGLVDLDVPPPVVVPEIAGMRIFAGYAGWSAGQLEGEIQAGGWYVVDAEARDAFSPSRTGSGGSSCAASAATSRFVATFPDDPDDELTGAGGYARRTGPSRRLESRA